MVLDPTLRTALQAIALAVMLFGLLSNFIPAMPAPVIVWVPALVYGLLTGFNWVNGILFALITGLMVFASVVDNLIMGQRARQQGASWLAIAVSLVAGIAGSILLPPFGGLLAALVGLFVVEVIRLRNLREAFSSTKSMAIGCGWAAIIRFGVGILMILLWLGWVYFT